MKQIEDRIVRRADPPTVGPMRGVAARLCRGMVVCTRSFTNPENGELIERGKSWWLEESIPVAVRDNFSYSDEEVAAAVVRGRQTETATARPGEGRQQTRQARVAPKTSTPVYAPRSTSGGQVSGTIPARLPRTARPWEAASTMRDRLPPATSPWLRVAQGA